MGIGPVVKPVEQPRAEDEVFSTEVFEASQQSRRVDLDVGEALNGSEAAATNKLKTITTQRTAVGCIRNASRAPR